ncbi:hypothetical protein QJQ45_000547 [Haematococcus lacustris]|nr:hypothetical protein QJQ45_000547 [Haematococcus lacustris]
MATRSRIRALMCSTSINSIKFYDRDVSYALNIRRIAAGPGRPRELSSWPGRPTLIADDTYIISGKMLKDRFGNKVKQKHYIALNKLAAMASRDKCPNAIEAKAIADKRDTTLNLPAAQRKIKHWAAGLTELAEEDSKHRYADIRSYAVAKQPLTQPPAQEPTAECAHQPDDTRRRSSRLRNKALNPPPTTPQPKPPPMIGNKRQADDRHTQTIPEAVIHIPIMTLESLSSWKVNAACERNAKELGIMLAAMYDHQESITKIDGWHWNGINKESYYNVHWRPTIVEKWALPMCKEEGYTPMHTEDISRADAKHACTCELCWEPIGDSPMCNSCMRAYHPACLAQTGLAGKTANNHWLCPVCAHGSDDLKGDMKQSAATDLLQVHWHPTTEPKALIQAHIDYTAKQKEYDAENNRRQGTGRPPPDAGLPGHTNQVSRSLSAGSSYQHQTRRTSCSAQSSCWANATSVAAAADAEDGLRSQRPKQLAQCPPKAHDVMAAAVGEAVLAAAAMVAAVAAAQQE